MDMVRLSIQAKRLLEEGVMSDIFDLLREDLQAEMLRTGIADKDKREDLFLMLKALDRLEMKFTWVVTKDSLDKLNEQQNINRSV